MIKKFYFNKRTSQLTITDQKICISKYLQSSGQIWIKQNVNINRNFEFSTSALVYAVFYKLHCVCSPITNSHYTHGATEIYSCKAPITDQNMHFFKC